MDRRLLISALLYGLLGLCLGTWMAFTHDHTQRITHAHVMELGFVTTFLYALCHRLWLNENESTIALVQGYLHHIGTLMLLGSFYALYGGLVGAGILLPFLVMGPVLIILALLLMLWMIVRHPKPEP